MIASQGVDGEKKIKEKKMSDENIKVYLEPNYTDILSSHPYRGSIDCGRMSIYNAAQYIKTLAIQKPSNSYCIRYVECMLKTRINNDDPDIEVNLIIHVAANNGCIDVIYCERRGEHETACKYCVQNIANGKCKDKLVVEHIGKVFFPEKYKER